MIHFQFELQTWHSQQKNLQSLLNCLDGNKGFCVSYNTWPNTRAFVLPLIHGSTSFATKQTYKHPTQTSCIFQQYLSTQNAIPDPVESLDAVGHFCIEC